MNKWPSIKVKGNLEKRYFLFQGDIHTPSKPNLRRTDMICEYVGKKLCIIRIFCGICFCVFSIYFGIFSLSTWTVTYLSIKSVYGILKGMKTCVYCILEFFDGGAGLLKAFLVLLKNVFSYLYQQNSNCITIQYFIHRVVQVNISSFINI